MNHLNSLVDGLTRLAGPLSVTDAEDFGSAGSRETMPDAVETPRTVRLVRRHKKPVPRRPQSSDERPTRSLYGLVAAARAQHGPLPPVLEAPATPDAGFPDSRARGVEASGNVPPPASVPAPQGAAKVVPEGKLVPEKILPDHAVHHYRVPTFVDADGWRWMVYLCVSRYILLQSLAERTAKAGLAGGAFEAHAMGMLYNSAVYLWDRDDHGTMRSRVLGPKSVAAHEQARPAQHLVFDDGRWALYEPERDIAHPVASSSQDSLYAALLSGYGGQTATPDEIDACRHKLAKFMRAESNRESFAARALEISEERLRQHIGANPNEHARLSHEISMFKPVVKPPHFLWDGESWPHPDCTAAYDLAESLVRPMRHMGAWGSELEAEAVANAMGWRVHMWKPKADGLLRRNLFAPQYERLRVYGPEAGEPKHVVNIIDNRHFRAFIPDSDGWRTRADDEGVQSSGQDVECGGGGDCLYYSLLGRDSDDAQVRKLRAKMVAHIQRHPETYHAVASAAADTRWNDFVASSSSAEVAAIAKRAEAYCALQLRANRA